MNVRPHMRIFLTVQSIPELASLPAIKRDEVWQRCHRKAWRHWQTWLAFLVSLGTWAAGFYFVVFAQTDDSISWPRMLLGLLLLILGSGSFFPFYVTMARPYIAEELRQ